MRLDVTFSRHAKNLSPGWKKWSQARGVFSKTRFNWKEVTWSDISARARVKIFARSCWVGRSGYDSDGEETYVNSPNTNAEENIPSGSILSFTAFTAHAIASSLLVSEIFAIILRNIVRMWLWQCYPMTRLEWASTTVRLTSTLGSLARWINFGSSAEPRSVMILLGRSV